MTIETEAISEQPLTSLEIVVNGKVIAGKLGIKGSKAELKTRTRIAEGSWIAARCTEEDRFLSDREMADYESVRNSRSPRACRLRFAHTSPIYVKVDGKGVRVAESIAEAGGMLDAFEAYAAEHVGDSYKADLKTALVAARERLKEGDTRSD